MIKHRVYALWGVRDATSLLAPGVRVNVADEYVASAVLRLAHLDPAPEAFVTVAGNAEVSVEGVCDRFAGWLVETETPIEPPVTQAGERAPYLANIALLRRPEDLDYDEWLRIWKVEHTPIGIADQGNVAYMQHRVLERLTPDTPDVSAIVEEWFPLAALTDFHAFYGSDGDEDELAARMTRMLSSVTRFGADRDIDVIPTSPYSG